MKVKITKREFQIMALYSKGLTFREMAQCLNIAERTAINHFMNVKKKNKKEVQKATRLRIRNEHLYQIQLKEKIKEAKKNNRQMEKFSFSSKYIVSIATVVKVTRFEHIQNCALQAYRSYYKHSFNELKRTQKVNSEF